MQTQLTRSWWTLVLRGVLAILFGIIAFIVPHAAVAGLVTLFGVYVLVDGVFALIAAFQSHKHDERWFGLIFEGVFGVLAGLIAFVYPISTAITLIWLTALWAIFTGVFEILAAIRLRKHIENEILLGLTGLASVLLGIVLLAAPTVGLLTFAYLLGGYALAFGVLMIGLGLRLRGLHQSDMGTTTPTGTVTPRM